MPVSFYKSGHFDSLALAIPEHAYNVRPLTIALKELGLQAPVGEIDAPLFTTNPWR